MAVSLVDVRSAFSFAAFAMAADVAHGLLAWLISGISGTQLHLGGLSGLPLEVVLTGVAALALFPLLRRFGLGAERRETGLLGQR
jgi:rod shape-determining protein MreD